MRHIIYSGNFRKESERTLIMAEIPILEILSKTMLGEPVNHVIAND